MGCEVDTNVVGPFMQQYGPVKINDLTPANYKRIMSDLDLKHKYASDGFIDYQDHYCKLILRPLESMTEEEKHDIWELCHNRKFPDSGTITFYPALPGDKRSSDRWCLWSGVDRVGIEIQDGYVWADCDLKYVRINSHEVTAYLLKKGFDLFDLHAAGLAVYENDKI
jgi:hypothetical protein